MEAEIIAVGTELLLGDILNTNAQFLARQLADLGVSVRYQHVVGDNAARLEDLVRTAKARSELLVFSGGLGPTADDLTKETVARCYHDALRFDQEEMDKITAFFAKSGRTTPANNEKQAMVPTKGGWFENPNGTAPAVWFEAQGKRAVLLPGPPSELEPLWKNAVRPFLQKGQHRVLESLVLRLTGIGESHAEELLGHLFQNENPTAAVYAKTSELLIRVTAAAPDRETARAMCRDYAQNFYRLPGEYIYAEGEEGLEYALVKALREKGLTLATAEKFADYPAIYFPHNCDFRGRIYAIPENLHPQGSDSAKGLLEYAEGKTIDTHEALLWLKIAGANHSAEGKIDKASFAARAAWIDAHEQEICAIAADPIENTQWTKADEPWQYLAWCCDYAAYLAAPENYKSHAVVAMDGSCNGLQHYSAMLRDPDGARAVNLEPSDKPSDIYQIVADKVIAKLKTIINNPAATAQDKDTATRWLAVGIDRGVTKRSVMVVPYSGTQLACRKYIQEHLEEKIDKQVSQALADNIGSGATYMEIDQAVRAAFPFVTDRSETDIDTFKASTWLAKHVWAAIGETITSAKTAMTSLQQLAKAATSAGLPVQWTTPSGFVIRQSYFDTKLTRLETKLRDTKMFLRLNQETAALSPSEQANAIAPNFVHSLDAAALVKTVNRCAAEDITAFAMVHDSYATHAADAPRMARILREEFIKLYTDQDPLAELWQNTNKQITENGEDSLSPLPAKKSFDLEKVSDSLYFFA